MTLDEIKTEIRALSAEDRRKLGLFILELEKDHFQQNVAPQLVADLEGLSRAVQESVERIKNRMK